MTKFIDTTKGSNEKTTTVFTHVLSGDIGWEETITSPGHFEEVKYLEKCEIDGDMFACLIRGRVSIFKGTKGSEFD